MAEKNSEFKNVMKHDGYSNEEKYFYEVNQGLIRRAKEESHRERVLKMERKQREVENKKTKALNY